MARDILRQTFGGIGLQELEERAGGVFPGMKRSEKDKEIDRLRFELSEAQDKLNRIKEKL